MDKAAAVDHIRNHAGGYPTTAASLKQACNNMSEFSAEDKQWFMDNLPEATYNSPEEVMKAVGW